MQPTVRERARYALDRLLSGGTVVLIAGLFATLAIAVFVVAVFLTLVGAHGEGAPDAFFPLLWHNLQRTLDAGTMADDSGPPIFLAAMLFVTLVGVFAFSALIGVISTGLEGKFAQLRKGRSRVLEHDHVVVLGWSQEIFTILSELVIANANRPRAAVVVLADRDKVEMEDELKARVGKTGRTKIICRTGNPSDVDDIDIANIQASRAVIVLSSGSAEPDTDVLKTLLAILNDPDRRRAPYHVVAEIQKPTNVEAARLIGAEEVELVVADHAISKIIAQTCRQSGLSVVLTELLNFSGDEMYIVDVPTLAGRTFGDALNAFDTSSVLGIHDGRVRLNPPSNTRLSTDSRLIVIAADDDTTTAARRELPSIAEEHIAVSEPPPAMSERTLVLGWNHRGPEIVTELDKYVTSGSEIVVVADAPRTEEDCDGLETLVESVSLSCSIADSSDRGTLDALDIGSFDHVVVLSYADDADVQHADARTLTTLIHLRDIASATEGRFSITSEMLDGRNRTLGEVAKPDDFIISNHIVSLLLAQIAENKALAQVFEELFAAAGADLYLTPADDYVVCGQPLTFHTVVEAARRRGELALGYRVAAASDDPSRHYGVVFNPVKTDRVTFAPEDRIIVLADQ